VPAISGSRGDVQAVVASPAVPLRDTRQVVLLEAALVAAAAVFYLSPLPIALAGLAALAVLTWRRLDLALPLVLLFAPFYSEPRHIGSHAFAPSEIFLTLDVVIALALLATRRLTVRVDALRSNPFLWPAALLFLGATLSTLLAMDRHDALDWYLLTVVEPLAFFVLAVSVLRERWQWVLLAAAVVAAGLVAGIIGLVAALPMGLHGVMQHVRGPYGSPDNLGLLYDRVIPLTAALAAAAAGRLRSLWWAILVFTGAVLILTYSRGAWAGVAAGVLFMAALATRRGPWLVVGTVVLAVGAGVIAGPKIVHALRVGHAGTVQRRVDIWHSAVSMIHNHPLLGVGPDNFQRYYAPTRQEDRWQHDCAPGLGYMQPSEGWEPCLSHPHEEILDFWLSTGILGLIAYAWLQVMFWRRALKDWFVRRDALTLGVMGAMLAGLVHGLVDNSYFLPDLALIFWLLCALAVALPPSTRRAA